MAKMITFCLNFVLIVLLSNAELVISINSENQYCLCVPYWQCKEDHSCLIENDLDIDVRKLQFQDECVGDFDVCCQIQCGKGRVSSSDNRQFLNKSSFGSPSPKYHNYDEAGFGEFPWMLALIEEQVYVCGASLIHPRVAVTAAHCVVNKRNLIVRAGEWNWALTSEPFPHQDRSVRKVIFHPSYHPASLRNDVALIIVTSSFKLSENVGLACLPRSDNEPVKKNCVATGWGSKNGLYRLTLKKVKLAMMPRQGCQYYLQNARLGPFFTLHNSFICAAGETDTCQGDGGSPLVCPIDGHAQRYEQVGIVAWGLSESGPGVPGVYVNLGLFRSWIDYTMRSLNFNIDVYQY